MAKKDFAHETDTIIGASKTARRQPGAKTRDPLVAACAVLEHGGTWR